MESAANQKLVVRVPQECVARFGDAQVVLGLFVAGIQTQRFTELYNGLGGLALGQVHFAQIIVGNCQRGIPAKCRQIMLLGLLEIAFGKQRIAEAKIGV